MIFLHTSDWHLGIKENERSLAKDQRHFIDEICEIIKEKKVDAVLLAGDVYDTSVSSAEAIRLYDYAMAKIVLEMKVPVLTIAGNHDSADRIATCSGLLKEAGLYVKGTATKVPFRKDFDDTEVYFLPWVSKEMVKSLYPDESESIDTISDAYSVMASHIKETFTEGKKHFVISHAYMSQTETTDSEQMTIIGTAEMVDISVFEGFDYVALGHLHKPQDVGTNGRYCGTPMAYSFGKEESQVKSVTLIDTATMEREIVPLHPLHVRKTLTAPMAELLAAEYGDDIVNGYVKLDPTDAFLGGENVIRLRQIYPNCLAYGGKTLEAKGSIRMTMQEFETLQKDPVQIFMNYFRDQYNREAPEHLTELFTNAVKATQEDKE